MDSQRFEGLVETLRERVAPLRSAADSSAVPPAISEALKAVEDALEELRVSFEGDGQPPASEVSDLGVSETARLEWHDFVDLAPNAYILTDEEGLIRDVNRVATSLFGVARDGLIGKPLAVFLPLEERRDFHARILQPLAPGEKQEVEMRLTTRGAKDLSVLVTLTRLAPFAGNQTDVTWIIHNTTPRRRVEEALRAALETVREGVERLDVALRHAPVAVLTTDRRSHHTVLHGPPLTPIIAALSLTGADDSRPPEGVADLLAFEKTVLHRGVGERCEIGISAPGGQLVYYDVTAELLRDGSGKVIGLTLLAWDATERRLAVEALQQAREGLLQEVARLEAVVGQSAVDLETSRQQARDLGRKLVEIQEQERRAIARELHDEAGQVLTALIMGLGAIEKEEGQPQSVLARVAELKQMADGAMEALHHVAAQLRPVSLDRVGLVPALRQHLESVKQQAHLDGELVVVGLLTDQRLPPDVETAVYRIVQEALTNVVRHAAAHHVSVIVERQGDALRAIIEDDGAGFDPEAAMQKGRLGMLGMRERVELLGGSLAVESAPGRGSTVFAEVPCGG